MTMAASLAGAVGLVGTCLTKPRTAGRYLHLRREMTAWDYRTNVLPEARTIYIEVPKAACTSVKHILSEKLGHPAPEDEDTIHDRRVSGIPTIMQTGVQRFFELADAPDTLVFTIVRNPYARIVSYYKNQVEPHPVSDRRAPARRQIRAYFGRELARLEQDKPLPFDWYVRLTCATAQTSSNTHWLAMNRMVPQDDLRCNFIGRIEQFDTDIQTVRDHLGMPPATVWTNRTRPSRLRDWLSDEQAKAIYRAYQDDFERFEYPQALPD